MSNRVISVSASPSHTFSKARLERIRLLEGEGVEGDAHCGATVKHRSRLGLGRRPPNLRQVHLVHEELFAELAAAGFTVTPGDIGENVTTRGVDLLALPVGTELHLGAEAIVRLTGLRNPCSQLDHFQDGLMAAVLGRDAEGNVVRKSGVMSVVVRGGVVTPGDAIVVVLPPEPHRRLDRV